MKSPLLRHLHGAPRRTPAILVATLLLAVMASLPAAAQVLSCDVTRVTDEVSRSSLDALSGDGNRVAFRSFADLTGENPGLDLELFIWDAGSGFIQVAPEVPADTSADTGGLNFDGSHLAFVSEGNLTGGNPSGFPQVFLWEEGVGLWQLTDSLAAFSMQSVVIDGDGDRVVFATEADLTAGNPDNSWEVFLWVEGVGITQITSSMFDSREPDISADGTRIVFRSGANLVANNADGNSEIFLWEEGAGFTQITDTTGVTNRDPSISADGNRIVLISPADLDGTPTPFTNLYVWDPGTGFQLVPGSEQALVTSVDADGDRTAWSDGSVWLWDETEGLASAPLDSEEIVMLDDAGDTIAFWSDSPLVGPNPDGEDEIYVADCVLVASVLEVPTLSSLGAALLAGLLLAAGLFALRRSVPTTA